MVDGPPARNLSHLLPPPPRCRETVRAWLQEDIPSFDYAGVVVGTKPEEAVLLCKSPGVLAGAPFFETIFRELDCEVAWNFDEGSVLAPVCEVARVRGPANRLLQGERTALNVLSRASGVASHARDLVQEARALGWKGEVAGTRKTTPGFRLVEKYALMVGGASPHRMDLSAMIMLKDNHLWSAGGVEEAVTKARKVAGFSIKIEVECRSLEQARAAARSGADIVMLDNFDRHALAEVSNKLKSEFSRLTVEASGGVKKENLSNFCLPSVDVISLSSTTQGYSAVNFSLKILSEGHDPHNPTVTMETA